MENEGINKLARVMQARMQQVGERPPVLDFGEILPDYSLRCNSFPVAIPADCYLVCRGVALGKEGEVLASTKAGQGLHNHGPSGGHSQESGDGLHSHSGEGPHAHDALVPAKLRGLLPGDRVLVAWVGGDAVVLDLIMPAKEAFA